MHAECGLLHGTPLQEFTFTLTYGDGRRFQGFCRKFLPPAPSMGSKLRYPQVIFIIAEFPWCNFYFKASPYMQYFGSVPCEVQIVGIHTTCIFCYAAFSQRWTGNLT